MPTPDTPLMAKTGQAETSSWGWGEHRASLYPACAGEQARVLLTQAPEDWS